MKWSTVAKILFVVPLALAATPSEELVERTKGRNEIMCSGSSCSSGSGTVAIEVFILWVCNGGGSGTKTMNAVSSVEGATQATHSVTVGGPAGLVYTPDSLKANIGDIVVFSFMSQNHTATQSAFTTPCIALPGGMDSHFMPNINNSVVPPPQMAIQVMVSTPLWFYCRQKGHCGKGMTFSINPTANKTQAMFEQMAIAQNGTGSTSGTVASSSPAAGSSVVAPPVAATTSLAATGTSGVMIQGTGTGGSGSVCSCSCFCGVANYPAALQGLWGFGGMSGYMPMSAAGTS